MAGLRPGSAVAAGPLAPLGVRAGAGGLAFTAAGHDSPDAIAERAACCSQAPLAALGGRRDPWTGRIRPPSVRTFSRIFGRIVFDGGSFGGARFSSGTVYFDGARFSGGTVSLDSAQTSGGTVRSPPTARWSPRSASAPAATTTD